MAYGYQSIKNVKISNINIAGENTLRADYIPMAEFYIIFI